MSDQGQRREQSSEIVLYRCPTRTNVLCPCGAVARRLGKLELSFRTERVPYRRNSRPEIEELTRQRRVPVLVDGEEIVHDSKRIIQYLDWKYAPEERPSTDGKANAEAKADAAEKKERKGRRVRRGERRKGRKKDEDDDR